MLLRSDNGRIRKKFSGFTLVELIVVIAILAILATVGFLSLQGYSSDAKNSKARTNIRSVHSAIASESAATGNSPRKYVVHDPLAALTGAFVYVDRNPVALSGGNWNDPGTNYSAGNPDWASLKLDSAKFRVTEKESAWDVAYAAVATDQPIVGAFDYSESIPGGKKRTRSQFQVAAVSSDGKAAVLWDYVAGSGSIAGLIRADLSPGGSATGALVDGSSASVPVACSATTQSGFAISSLPIGTSSTFYKTVANGTGSIVASCPNGTLAYASESYVCASPLYWNGTLCANMYTTTSGNANYSVTLPKDGTAYWYTVGKAKENGYLRFEIQRVGDTYAYGGIYLDDRQAFFPREYGNIDKDPYFAGNLRYSGQWVETGVDTSNNGASGYATIWVNKGETIKLMGHRSTMTITGNLIGASPAYE